MVRPGNWFIVIILMWLKGCVEDDAHQGDPHARRLLDETSATIVAARELGAEAGRVAYRDASDRTAEIVSRAADATSASAALAGRKADELRRRAQRVGTRMQEYATSASLAAGDLAEGGGRAADRLRDAWRRSRSRFD
jgi:hypothetical protein